MRIKSYNYKWLLVIPTLLSIFFAFSCTEEYWPEFNANYEFLLTVDGRITNDPGPYTIKLLKSSSIDTNNFNPISGALVTIIDSDGSNERLLETERGVYQTRPNGIQGVIGHEYKITIETNGKHYESSFEKLLEPVGLESITAEWTQRSGSTSDEDELGFQFYLSTQMADNPINYYYWELSETFRYQSYFKAYLVYDGSGAQRVRDADTVYNCWLTTVMDQRFTFTTKNLSVPKITHFPINFTPNSEKFEFKYALQAKQYRISENAYIFLSSLVKQNNVEDILNTSQPYQILGNVYNVDDLDEPVLGYFLTAGVSTSQPAMVKRPREYISPVNWLSCDNPLRSYNTNDVLRKAAEMPSYLWPIFLPANPNSETVEPIFVKQSCVDCRQRKEGGVNVKPDYWDDNSLLIFDNPDASEIYNIKDGNYVN